MAGSSQQRIDKIERLLSQRDQLVKVVRTHENRVRDAHRRLDLVDDDLEMYVQHRAIPDDLRERVSSALANGTAEPVETETDETETDETETDETETDETETDETETDETETDAVPDDARELTEQV